MIILALRTEKPEAELYVYDSNTKLAEIKWQANLRLAESINTKIEEILNMSSKSLADVNAIAVFKGPGSFTGLRIGVSVANALAYAQNIPIVARGGSSWLQKCIEELQTGGNDKAAIPKYGSPAHVTKPRK